MRVGSSLVLIAAGAILKYAVAASISGINLSTVGVVLMAVGIAGVVLSLIMASTRPARTGCASHRASGLRRAAIC